MTIKLGGGLVVLVVGLAAATREGWDLDSGSSVYLVSAPRVQRLWNGEWSPAKSSITWKASALTSVSGQTLQITHDSSCFSSSSFFVQFGGSNVSCTVSSTPTVNECVLPTFAAPAALEVQWTGTGATCTAEGTYFEVALASGPIDCSSHFQSPTNVINPVFSSGLIQSLYRSGGGSGTRAGWSGCVGRFNATKHTPCGFSNVLCTERGVVDAFQMPATWDYLNSPVYFNILDSKFTKRFELRGLTVSAFDFAGYQGCNVSDHSNPFRSFVLNNVGSASYDTNWNAILCFPQLSDFIVDSSSVAFLPDLAPLPLTHIRCATCDIVNIYGYPERNTLEILHIYYNYYTAEVGHLFREDLRLALSPNWTVIFLDNNYITGDASVLTDPEVEQFLGYDVCSSLTGKKKLSIGENSLWGNIPTKNCSGVPTQMDIYSEYSYLYYNLWPCGPNHPDVYCVESHPLNFTIHPHWLEIGRGPVFPIAPRIEGPVSALYLMGGNRYYTPPVSSLRFSLTAEGYLELIPVSKISFYTYVRQYVAADLQSELHFTFYMNIKNNDYVFSFRMVPDSTCGGDRTFTSATLGSSTHDYCGCPRGFHHDELQPCVACEPGKSSSIVGQFACDRCDKGRYAPQPQMSVCAACPLDSVNADKSLRVSQSECFCMEGFYGNASGPTGCKRCDSESSVCPPSSQYPLPQAGFWRNPNNKDQILRCFPAESCEARSAEFEGDNCSPGYTGYLCGLCTAGFYASGNSCTVCKGGSGALFPVLVVLVIAVVFLFASAGVPSFTKIHSVGITVTWIQLVSLFTSLPANWPRPVFRLFQIFSLTNLNLDLFSVECSVTVSFWTKFVLKSLSPIFFAVGFFVMYCVHRLFAKIDPRIENSFSVDPETPDPYWKTRYLYGFMNLFVTAHTLLASTVTQFFNCTMSGDGIWVMSSNPSVQCFQKEWNNWIPFAVIFSFLYTIAFPLAVYVFVHRYKAQTNTEWFMARFGSLILPYRAELQAWEIFNMMRRSAIILIIDLLTSISEQLRIFLLLIVFFIILLLQVWKRPYRQKVNNELAFIWPACAILCLFVALVFNSSLGPNEETFFTVVLFAAIISALLISVRCLLKERQSNRALKLQERALQQKTWETRSTQHEATKGLFPRSGDHVWKVMNAQSAARQLDFFQDVQDLLDADYDGRRLTRSGSVVSRIVADPKSIPRNTATTHRVSVGSVTVS